MMQTFRQFLTEAASRQDYVDLLRRLSDPEYDAGGKLATDTGLEWILSRAERQYGPAFRADLEHGLTLWHYPRPHNQGAGRDFTGLAGRQFTRRRADGQAHQQAVNALKARIRRDLPRYRDLMQKLDRIPD